MRKAALRPCESIARTLKPQTQRKTLTCTGERSCVEQTILPITRDPPAHSTTGGVNLAGGRPRVAPIQLLVEPNIMHKGWSVSLFQAASPLVHHSCEGSG